MEGQGWRSPGFGQEDKHPVICVSWQEAKEYVDWLSRRTGHTYRLLTEAEWEYAARAGSTTRYSFGDASEELCRYANGADAKAKEVYGSQNWTFTQCSDGHVHTAAVGSYLANAFGLHDMHGNAWEWVEDCWVDTYKDAPTDGSSRLGGECASRVLRGGSWGGIPQYLRAAVRSRYQPDGRGNGLGFRLARTLNP
ncbi:MAG: formylglycine-generating enzyme family protein [Hyphomicrobiaceae bacterium]